MTPYPILTPASCLSDLDRESRQGRCALAIMAKAPRPGRVKTRLSPPLSLDEAAALNIAFLRDTAANLADLAAHSAAECVIAYTPLGDESAFDGLLPPGFALLPQRGEGFGERLLHAAQDLFALGFASVCLIDSDSPTVPRIAFELAVRALSWSGDRLVIGPSDDGGYYLIGLKRPHSTLFDRIAWSTTAVFAQTCERAAALALDRFQLPYWYDVDDAVSLALLEAELLDGLRTSRFEGYPAPHTRAALAARRANQASAVTA